MKKMNKMLLREILESKGQFIAAAAIVFAGITIFLAAYMSFQNLKISADYYYDKYKLMDYYAEAANIDEKTISDVKNVEGVDTAIGRLTKDVSSNIASDRKVILRLISVPDTEQPGINKLYFNKGDYFTAQDQGYCFINKQFAKYYSLNVGDKVSTTINLQKRDFIIKGIVSSPEYVDAYKSESSISSRDFGIIYIKQSEAANILGYGNSYNQVHVLFEKGADKKLAIDKIENILKSKGFKQGVERDKQLSYVSVKNDIEAMQQLAVMFPALFLLVAATVIYVSQKRIVSNQRTLIGVMKAFGYSNKRILGHYTMQSLLIAATGGLPAVLAGIFLGKGLTGLFGSIHNIPFLKIKVDFFAIFIGLALCLGFSLIAGYNAAKRILKIQPAEAMRSETPKGGKRILIERIGFLWRRLPFRWKSSLRNIFRSKSRTIFSGLGTVFTVMIFIIVFFLIDTMNFVLDYHFKDFLRQDYKVVFSQPQSTADIEKLREIKGIKKLESVLEAPVQVSKGSKMEFTNMVILEEGNTMYNLKNMDGKKINLTDGGVAVSRLLAERLSLRPGDTITISLPLQQNVLRDIRVDEIVNQYIGADFYMSDASFVKNGGQKSVTSALITVEKGMDNEVKAKLLADAAVDSVDSRTDSYNYYKQLMIFMYIFVYVMIAFGAVMGFSTIYNTTVISINERKRELASLKVLGYKRLEIEMTILRENLLIGLIAIIPGILLGRIVSEEFAKQFNSQNMIVDVIVSPRTYIITIASVIMFIIAAQVANRKSISGLDMVEVLKNREG